MRKTSATEVEGKKARPKTKLGIPDLEHSKAAVLRSLCSPDSQRGYQHAIDEFVAWYCSEPRLAFNRTVVLRYRFHLEESGLAPGTINVRMAAVRRLPAPFARFLTRNSLRDSLRASRELSECEDVARLPMAFASASSRRRFSSSALELALALVVCSFGWCTGQVRSVQTILSSSLSMPQVFPVRFSPPHSQSVK
jgi:hypothetical protein